MCEGAPKSFAIGVLGLPPGLPAGRDRRSRLAVTLHGYKLGYFVVDVVEVCDAASTEGAAASGYQMIEDLATQTHADAFVVQGPSM
jgi:hypothetical protein